MKSTYLLCLLEFECVESTRKVEAGMNFLKGITASQTPRSVSVRGSEEKGCFSSNLASESECITTIHWLAVHKLPTVFISIRVRELSKRTVNSVGFYGSVMMRWTYRFNRLVCSLTTHPYSGIFVSVFIIIQSGRTRTIITKSIKSSGR